MRSKAAFKNIISAISYQIVSVICGLITPRLILVVFGSTYNGVITSATQFLSLINIINIGITGATRVALYKSIANNDLLGTSRIIKATKIYMSKVAAIVAVYAAALCIIYPYISHNDLMPWENAALIAIISIGTIAEYLFGFSNSVLILASQSGYITSIVNTAKIVLNTILVVVIIKLGGSIFTVKLGSSVIYFISPLFLSLYVKKKFKLTNKCEPDYDRVKNRGDVAFHSVANIIHDNTDLVVLTLFSDAKIISVYSVYNLIVGQLKNFFFAFTNGLESSFGNMWANREYDTLKKNFNAMEYLIFSFVTVVFTCTGLLMLPFVALYTREVTDIVYARLDLVIIFTLTQATFCLRQPYVILVQATGKYKETKRGAMAEALINLSLSLILVNFIGISGVILGTLAANIFRTVQYAVFISEHIIERDISAALKRFLWSIITSAVTVALFILIGDSLPVISQWIQWVYRGFIVFAAAFAVTLISSLLFYKSDFVFVLNTIKRILFNKKGCGKSLLKNKNHTNNL